MSKVNKKIFSSYNKYCFVNVLLLAKIQKKRAFSKSKSGNKTHSLFILYIKYTDDAKAEAKEWVCLLYDFISLRRCEFFYNFAALLLN